MSTINFICTEEQKSYVIEGVWLIVRNHYFQTATPNSNVKYEYEGKDVYLERLDELMKSNLCEISDTETGFSFSFDSTEDAGYSIADEVYKTNMGYQAQGLTYVNDIFKNIVKEFKDIAFDAHCECCDEYVELESEFSYDGKILTINSIDIEKYDEIMGMMSSCVEIEEISEKTGVPVDTILSFMS